MSFITIPNATVDRHISTGTGYSIFESYTSKTGETFKTYFTVWSRDLLEPGTQIKVSGKYSDKLAEIEKDGEIKRYINRSINDPKVEVLVASTPAVAPASAVVDEDAPF